ncbi:DUF5615 family PIN-like protein [Haloferula sp.]|uniref:DUF5615 family PIN-like protein n=1 Tax=Haloferula sp. TaxID=2497595 RepID=UPI003C73F88B
MKVILDECLPKRLAGHLEGHQVTTVVQAGFSGLSNGRLLSAIQDDFEVFVTIDSNLEYQQALKDRPIGVIVIRSISNRLEDLLPLVPKILESLDGLRPGEVSHVG